MSRPRNIRCRLPPCVLAGACSIAAGRLTGPAVFPRLPAMTRVASIGECMIELSPRPGGLLGLGFGGDTLNTAVYLARLGVAVDYLTALGDDGYSQRMLALWQEEGVG